MISGGASHAAVARGKIDNFASTLNPTVGFHNFNLRIFNLRVSNPNKLIVDVFLTRRRISMCQGLGPKKTMRFALWKCFSLGVRVSFWAVSMLSATRKWGQHGAFGLYPGSRQNIVKSFPSAFQGKNA